MASDFPVQLKDVGEGSSTLAADLHKTLLDAVKAAMIGTDLTGNIIFWNPAAEELYGWSSAEVLGQNIMQITVSQETEQQAKEHMQSVIAGGSWCGEFHVRCKSGAQLAALVTLSPVMNPAGSPVAIVGVSQDLTALRGVEEALRRNQQEFETFANSLPELCWTARADGHVTWYNERWYEYTGTTPEQMEGWGWQSVHDPEYLPSVMERWQESIRAGSRFEMEFPLRGADGVFRWFLTRVRPVLDSSGSVTRWFGTNTNIDEQRQIHSALSAARHELEVRVRERTGELQVANDDLRQLSGRLQQLRDEERRQIARELHDSVGQMLAALSMNTATVQSQAHKLDPAAARAVIDSAGIIEEISKEIRTISHLLHPPLLDLAGLASAVRWYVDGFSERSKIKVEIEIPPEFRRLSEEMEIALFRLVQECLTNIHRHSGSTTARISMREEADKLLVEIEDHGKGIPADKQKQFGSGRTGVGFRGIRERLRQFGGDLNLQSDAKGTLVTANIPLETVEVTAKQKIG